MEREWHEGKGEERGKETRNSGDSGMKREGGGMKNARVRTGVKGIE